MCYIISVSKTNIKLKGGFMKKVTREIKVTRAGYLYVDGKKATEKRITPLYVGQDVLTQSEQKIARKWAYDHYKMVNN